MGGFLRVKGTLQIADKRFGNIFAAGEVIDSPGPMNGRSAMQQAAIVSGNILRATQGRPLVTYNTNLLMEGGIDSTLGMVSY